MNLTEFQIEFEKIVDREPFSNKIKPIRKKAFNNFSSIGFPSKKWEDWRFTNLTKIKKNSYTLSDEHYKDSLNLELDKFHIPDVFTILFINGHYSKEKSDKIDGVELMSNSEYFDHKNWSEDYQSDCPFELLNTAFMDSGMNLIINENQNIMKPIRFLFATSTAEEIMITPKVNIDCGESSSFTFIEHYVGGSNNFFFNSSISCFLNKNSSMHHIKIIEESKKGLIFSKTNVQQENSSRYNFLTFNCDSNFSRAKIDTKLNGEGAECSLSGLSLSRDNQQLGTHIVTNHFSPNCYSNQNFKNILLDNSSGIFNGRTIVHKNAQKTNSQQSNKNLILSKSAHMNSNPQLEIYADDVKCSHGSTTGELDNDALFYLRSRGLTLLEAKKLLVRGFAIDLFKNLRHEPTKNHIIDKFENWLIQNTA